jgi:glycosyltransferase involved in cell wall biosynthesis
VQRIKKILVITHEASLGGAPILLLRLMRLLKDEGYIFNTLVMQDGPLYKEFDAISDVCVVYKKAAKKSVRDRIKARILDDTNSNDFKKLLREVDVVLNNTIVNGLVIELIKSYSNIPIITYVHELEMVTNHLVNKDSVKKTYKSSKLFFVPCKAVYNFLVEDLKISSSSIYRLNYYLPDSITVPPKKNIDERNKEFIVGAMGAVDWRKGSDVFLQIAILVSVLRPTDNIKFKWLGARANHIETDKALFDLNKIASNNIEILYNNSDTSSFFDSIDLLLVTSREDPYPVVVLEAATHKIPSICFEKSGGATEFISNDAGSIVPYMNVMAMANSILYYYDNATVLKSKGKLARQKCLELHQDKELILKQFSTALKAIRI